MKLAVHYHLYYQELAIELISILNRFSKSIDIHLTISNNVNSDIVKLIKANHSNVKIYRFNNIGRDLYPFWKLCKKKIFDEYDFILKIHGKLSKHRKDGSFQRHHFTDSLAPEGNPLELIKAINNNKKIRVLADRKSLIQTDIKNWTSNLFWTKEILNRHSVQKSTYSDVDFSNTPLIAGSFYWATQSLVCFFKKIKISENDWKQSETSTNKIDGKLEHTLERLISFDLFDEKNIPIKVFEKKHGKLTFQDLNLKKIGENYQSFVKNELMRNELFLHYSIESNIPNRTILKIILFKPFKVASLIDIDIKINGKKINDNLEMLEIIDEANIDNRYICKLQIYGNCQGKDISITRKNDYHGINIISEKLLVNLSKRNISLTQSDYNDYSNFLTTETLKRNKLPLFKLIRESESGGSVYNKIKGGMIEMSKMIEKNSMLKDKPKKHVFIINSSMTAIVSARIIEYLKLKKQDILIIYHRIKSSPLMDDFISLHTNIPDYEIDSHLINSKQIYESVSNILSNIDGSFKLYAYHYFSYLVYFLAWNPKCISADLIEEGNLNDEKIYIDRLNYNYKANKPFSENLNFISPLVHNKILYETCYLNLFHGPSLSAYKKDLYKLIDNYFLNGKFSIQSIDNLKFYRKDYLWHPKMILGANYYHVSKSSEIPYLCNTTLILKESKKEIEISKIYKDKIQSQVLIIFPVDSSVVNADKLKKPLSNIFTSSKNIKIDFLKHPADKKNVNYKEIIFKSIKSSKKNKIEINDLSNEGLVTDLLACEYRNVIHFGSSIKRLIKISKNKIKEFQI